MARPDPFDPLSDGFDPYDDTGSLFGSIKKGFSTIAKPVGKVAAKAIKVTRLPGDFVADKVKNVPVVGSVYGAVHRLSNLPSTITIGILEGGRIDKVAISNLKQSLQDAKTIGPWAQTVVSFVPGIGTGISAAIGAGLALADGRPISQAMIQAVKGALPGGATAQIAFGVAQGALERKPIDQIAINALPISDQQKRILTQGLQAAKDIASGKNVSHAIVDNAIKSLPPQYAKAVQVGMAIGHAKSLQDALKTGAKGAVIIGAQALSKGNMPSVKQSLPVIQNVLKNSHGAFGSLAGKSLGAMAGGLSGRNLQRIGLAAASGALPANIKKAVDASNAIRNGSPALLKSLADGVSHFSKGSPESYAYALAVNTLKKAPNDKALAYARRSLATEGERRAFDSAIGIIAQTANQNARALVTRAGSAPIINLTRQRGGISPWQPNLKNAIDTIRRNPTLAIEHPLVLANKFGTNQQTVLQALNHLDGERLMPWRSLTPAAIRFIRKWHPNAPLSALGHGTNDTAGLDETGTKYIVAKGDSPWSIAQKLSGNGNNWKQLIPLNKDKKPSVDKSVWVGEVLNIPPSWQKPSVTPVASPGPAASSQPALERPTAPKRGKILSTTSVAPSILQAKSILVAWSKTDGVNQPGFPDYGQKAEDLSTTFGTRDSFVLSSFQNWDNKSANAGLKVDGILGPKSLAALQQWAETRSGAALPPGSPAPGNVTTLPEIVIEGSVPTPALPPVSTPALPAISTPPVSAPVIPPVSAPSTPAAVKPADSAPSEGGASLGLAVAGAAAGGLIGGLPGAIIGGIGGALIA